LEKEKAFVDGFLNSSEAASVILGQRCSCSEAPSVRFPQSWALSVSNRCRDLASIIERQCFDAPCSVPEEGWTFWYRPTRVYAAGRWLRSSFSMQGAEASPLWHRNANRASQFQVQKESWLVSLIDQLQQNVTGSMVQVQYGRTPQTIDVPVKAMESHYPD
jgi:hypothetical protein